MTLTAYASAEYKQQCGCGHIESIVSDYCASCGAKL